MSDDDIAGAGGGRDARSAERAARRVEKASEKAARAQRRADEARRKALDAVRAGGFLDVPDDGMGAGSASRGGTTANGDADVPAATVPADVPTATPDDGPDSAAYEVPATSSETPFVRKGRTPAQARRDAARKGSGRVGSALRGPWEKRTGAPVDPVRRRRTLITLALVSVLMAGLAGLSAAQWRGARDAVAAEQAVDSAPTRAVEAAQSIVTDMFTYDWQNVGERMASVEPRLTGDAEEEFRTRSRAAAESAAKQSKASVFATVAAAAPTEVTSADEVTVLLMLNQMISTEADPKAQSSASRLTVTMRMVDGGWRLAALKAI